MSFATMLGARRPTARRVKYWTVAMRHPVTGVLLWTLRTERKIDATAEAAYNVRPDRAPDAPKPNY